MAEAPRRLYRSRAHRVLGGVCGGLAEYVGHDPVLVRVVFIALTLITGVVVGMVAYVILWIFVPERPPEAQAEEAPEPPAPVVKKSAAPEAAP